MNMLEINLKGEQIVRIRTLMELVLVALVIAGCSSTQKLMPTPNIYLNGEGYPESSVSQGLKNNKVDVLFVTDRKPETSADGTLAYGTSRSESLGFGSAIVEIGNDLTWQHLVEMSETSSRRSSPALRVKSRTELGRFPPTPHAFLVVDGKAKEDPKVRSEYERVVIGKSVRIEPVREKKYVGAKTCSRKKNMPFICISLIVIIVAMVVIVVIACRQKK